MFRQTAEVLGVSLRQQSTSLGESMGSFKEEVLLAVRNKEEIISTLEGRCRAADQQIKR